MGRILIVDDEPLNRELLRAYLEDHGHELIEADSGGRALELVKSGAPDVVLLDVMMPGLDGFQTTERIKAQTGGDFLPVILITALADLASRNRGLKCGADEFLTKPVDRQELLVRVGNLLALRAKERELLRRNVELIELTRYKEEMSALLVHDLKNPMSVILSGLDFASRAHALDEEVHEALGDALGASRRVMRLIANLVDLMRLESSRLEPRREPTALGPLLATLIAQRASLTRHRQITVNQRLGADAVASIDRDLIARVFENLLDNALQHTPTGGEVRAWIEHTGGAVQLRLGNSGPPIPPELRPVVFEKYRQASSALGRMNLGLGLYFCRLAVEAHGGRMWVEESADLPAVFGCELPRAGAAANEATRSQK